MPWSGPLACSLVYGISCTLKVGSESDRMAQAVFRQEEKDFKARLGSIVRLCVTRGEGEGGKGLEGRRGAEGGGKVFGSGSKC